MSKHVTLDGDVIALKCSIIEEIELMQGRRQTAIQTLYKNMYIKQPKPADAVRVWIRYPPVVEQMCTYLALQLNVSPQQIFLTGVMHESTHPCVTAIQELGDIRKNVQSSGNAILRKQLTTNTNNYKLFEGRKRQFPLTDDLADTLSKQAAAASLNVMDIGLLRFMMWYEELCESLHSIVIIENQIEVREYKLMFEFSVEHFTAYVADIVGRINISDNYLCPCTRAHVNTTLRE